MKTIKDFEWRTIWKNEDGGNGYAISLPNLIQEAIKHAKARKEAFYRLKKEIKFFEIPVLKGKRYEKIVITKEVEDWIKWFFNIKEHDLK